MKALILLADDFEDLQFFVPWSRLQEEGIETTIAAPSGKVVTGTHGHRVEPDMPIREVNPAEYDLLLVPGGDSPEKLRLREEAVDIARTFMDEDRLVAVVGHGAQLLISAGSLGGRRLTTAPGIRDDIRASGGQYRDEPVVRQGNLLSGRGSADLPDFCRALLAGCVTKA